MDENIKDLLPFYALGGLSEADKEQVDQYLRLHSEARQQLEADTTIVSALAYGVRPTPPSLRVKNGLMKRVEADVAERNRIMAQPAMLTRFLGYFRSGSMMPALAGLSLLVAILAGMWTFFLNTEVSRLQEQLAAVDKITAALPVDVTPIQLELGILRRENDALQQEASDQQEKLLALSTEILALQEENGLLKSDLSTQNDTLAAIRDDLSQSAIEVTNLVDIEDQLLAQSESISAQDQTIVALQQELAQLRQTNATLLKEVSAQREIMVYVTSPNVQPMLIVGTTALPTAKGQLIANPNDATGALIISGLPPLAPGLVYQFWLVHHTQGYIQAGIVDVDEEGVGTLIVNPNTQIGDFDAMGISIEAVDKTPEPTRESMIMLGALSS